MSLALITALPHRVNAPPLEPPYDDELPVHGGSDRFDGRFSDARLVDGSLIDGNLALALPLPFADAPRRRLRVVPVADGWEDEDAVEGFGPRLTARADLPPPGPRAVQLVRAVIEVLAGDRPVRHLSRDTALSVQEQLEAVAPKQSGSRRPWARSVRSLRVTEPTAGVAEVSAVVDKGSRCGALALRLEGIDGRWLVTALAVIG